MNLIKKAFNKLGHSQEDTTQDTTRLDESLESSPVSDTMPASSSKASSTAANANNQQASSSTAQSSTTTVTQTATGSSRAQTNGPDLGTYNPNANQQTSAVATGSGMPSYHQETQVYQSSVGGLNVQPIQTAINTDELYKDYLPNRNNLWMQNLITQMNSMSLEIDQYAKAQQEVISQEASEEINRVISVNKEKEAKLIASMHAQAGTFEKEYAMKKQQVIAQLDREQQVVLDKLQKDLHLKQQELAKEIKVNVEKIGQLAKQKKVQILTESQQKQDALGAASQQTTISQSVHASDLTKHHLFDKNASSADAATGANAEKSEHFHSTSTASKTKV